MPALDVNVAFLNLGYRVSRRGALVSSRGPGPGGGGGSPTGVGGGGVSASSGCPPGATPIGRNGANWRRGALSCASAMNSCHSLPGRLLPSIGEPDDVRIGEFMSVPIHTD